MANVSVSNTTGLYIGSGAASVLNNAQQLLGLLSNNGGVVFSLDPTTSNTKVQGNAQAGGGNYGNTNVAAFLPTYTGALNSMTGNVITTANVSGAFILGNGSQLTGLGATYSNTNVAAFLPTYTGAISSMTGNLTTTANVQGAFLLGNGSQITGITTNYSNTNVAAFLPTYTGAITSMTGNVTTTANVQGAFILGNGSQLTGISGSTYSNTNVAAFLPTYSGLLGGTLSTASQPNITAVGTLTSLTATNNITTTSGRFIGNGSGLTAIAGANVSGTVANATYAITSQFVTGLTGANVTTALGYVPLNSNSSAVSAGLATFVTGNAQANITSVGTLTNLTVTGNITSATGTFTGNGSGLTGNIIARRTQNTDYGPTSSNVSIESNGSISFYSNTNLQFLAQTGTINLYGPVHGFANADIDGNLTAGNLTAGNIVTTGTFAGNGSGLTGNIIARRTQNTDYGPTSPNVSIEANGSISFYANTNLQFLAQTGTINLYGPVHGFANADIDGNLTAGNIVTTGTQGNITGANYISGNFFVGNGAFLTGISSGSTYGDSNVAAFLPTYTGAISSLTGNVTTTANVQGAFILGNGSQLTGLPATYSNTNVAAFLPTYTGAITSMTGNLTTTANVQAAFFIGNGSQLTGISGGNATPGGSSTFIQYNNAGTFDGSANLIYQPADGNITLGNLVFNKNYNRILQTNAFDTTVQSSSQNATGQFIVGDGFNGNVTSPNFNNNQAIDGAFALINKSYIKTDNGRRAAGLGVQTFANVTANITNSGTAVVGIINGYRIGGNTTQTVINASRIVGINNNMNIGGGTGTFASLGNANIRVATGAVTSINPQTGSFVGNAFGYISNLEAAANNQFIDRMVNYSVWSSVAFTTPAFYGYHMPNNTSYAGISINNTIRQSPQYYFLYNEDDLAQVRLGSLRRYTEYRANITSSSGTLTVDKNTAQVQYLTPTEAVTTVTFSNFVTAVSNGSNNTTQTDTVTLIVQQGSTPYAITMPSGAQYKYAGGVTTVGNTANSVTMISTTATQNVSGGTDLYLITISPEFV